MLRNQKPNSIRLEVFRYNLKLTRERQVEEGE